MYKVVRILFCVITLLGMTWRGSVAHDETVTVGATLLSPYVMVDENGELSGLTIDLVDKLAEVAGLHLEYIEAAGGADELVEAIASGDYQVGARCLYALPERRELIDFTDGYVTTGPVLVTRVGDDAIQSVDDLTESTKVGVSNGGVILRYAQENLTGQLMTFAPIEGERGELLALVDGVVDVAVDDYINAVNFLQHHPNTLQIVGDILETQQCTLGVSKDHPDLLAALNDALAQIKANGSLDIIITHWLGETMKANTEPVTAAATETLTAGIVLAGPPVGFRDANGDLAGFGLDVTRAVAEAKGLELEIVEAPSFTELVEGIVEGVYDLTAVCVYDTPERAELIDFSDPYQPSGLVLVTSADNQGIQSIADVTPETTVGVVEGTAMADYAAANVEATIETYGSLVGQVGLLDAVAAREVEASLNDFITVQAYRKAHPDAVRIVGDPLAPAACHIGVSKEQPDLLATVNDALAQIKADGSLTAILADWLGDEALAPEMTAAGDEMIKSTISMTIVEEYADFVQVDLGERGDSIGDMEIWTSPLLDEQGAGIGTSSSVCIISDVEKSWYECQWTFHLDEGTLTIVGTETDHGEGTFFEMPVAGGTGTYAGVHGILRGSFTTEDDETLLYTYHLELTTSN